MRRLLIASLIAAVTWRSPRTPKKRYGVERRHWPTDTYPQDTPKETLASVLKAIEMQDRSIICWLSWPIRTSWIERVSRRSTAASSSDLVAETTGSWSTIPSTVKQSAAASSRKANGKAKRRRRPRPR